MRYYFYTVRTHPAEIGMFEDMLAILLPFCKKHEEYCYVIEKDGTPDRHLHFLIRATYPGIDKFKRALSAKKFNVFLSLINNGFTQTNQYAFNTQLVSLDNEDENVSELLGYMYKEENATRRESNGFAPEFIAEAIHRFWALERTRRAKPKLVDTKYLKLVTMETHIIHYCEKISRVFKEDNWYSIKRDMIIDGYSFVDIPDKKIRLLINEMELRHHDVGAKMIVTEDISQYAEYTQAILTAKAQQDQDEYAKETWSSTVPNAPFNDLNTHA